MLRHLLKLTWKRKTRNLMLSLEILLAFAIVFGIAAGALRYLQLYRMPIGFDDADVWAVQMKTGGDGPDHIPADVYDTLRRSLLELPEVRGVGYATFAPYRNATWRTVYKSPQTGATVETDTLEASDDANAVLGLRLTRRRWFTPADEGAAVQPIVLNRRAAAALFPGSDALGRQLTQVGHGYTRTLRVVGLVDEFRNKGPLMTPSRFVLARFAPRTTPSRVQTMLVRLAPGTPRAFEARLNRRLALVRNDWSYEIAPLRSMRASLMKEQLMPLTIVSVIAAFMLTMVAFGLFGVLWQSTTLRIPEIGLRRAVGASAAHVYRQIVVEQLLLSSIAMGAALVLLVQLPLTGALGEALDWPLFGAAAALSMAVIYLLSLLCALYPGWRASRLTPTQALHYE
jgi:putative ABC transport system permease protein